MEILTIKIDCVFGYYLEEESAKVCEIPSTYSLEHLCRFILKSFAFDNDHLHEFFISKRPMRSEKITIEDESTTLENIFPVMKNNFLFMNFDFGDNWMFKITNSRKKANFVRGTKYPRIIEHIGKNPEQYPDYEE